MDRITSPEQLNKMMKVSKARIWIILIAMLVFIALGIHWFINNEVVISEEHPCFISDKKVVLADYIYDTFYTETGNKELCEATLKLVAESYGEEYLNKKIYPAIIYTRDIENTELLEQMPIEVIGLKGSVFHIPTEKLDCKTIVKDASFTEKEMRQAGMDPGFEYYPIMAGLGENQDVEAVSGLYKAKIILNVLEPMSLILN